MVVGRPNGQIPSRRFTSPLRVGVVLASCSLLLTGCGLFAQGSPSHPAKSHSAAGQGQVSVKGNPAPIPKPDTLSTAPSGQSGVVGVTIDNEVAARPQSGLNAASLVFEAPAEGGITRFLALFWQHQSSQIGPVRSTRIYFDQLAQSYAFPFAHAGGNVDALNAIKPLGIRNIDAIWTPGARPYYWRSTTRQAPHNLYTSSADLAKAMHTLHLQPGPIPTWPQGALTVGKTATSVNIAFSGVEDARWLYSGGFYQRYEGSTRDLTLTGAAIEARAVLILYVGEAPDPDIYTPGSIKLLMTGSGTGVLAADGRQIPIAWQRSAGAPFQILTADRSAAQAMPAPPLWIELVPTGTPVTFGP